MRPKHITYIIAAGAATAVGLSQTKAGAGALLINGLLAVAGVATFPIARHVEIACAADESLITFTVTGTNRYGGVLSEDVAGVTAGLSAKTTKNFKTVTGVSVSAALTGNVLIGTSNSLQTGWIPVDSFRVIDAGVTKSSGAVFNWAIETTLGDVYADSEDTLPIDGAEGTPMGLLAATAIRLSISGHTGGNATLDIVARGHR